MAIWFYDKTLEIISVRIASNQLCFKKMRPHFQNRPNRIVLHKIEYFYCNTKFYKMRCQRRIKQSRDQLSITIKKIRRKKTFILFNNIVIINWDKSKRGRKLFWSLLGNPMKQNSLRLRQIKWNEKWFKW